jgi:hypothetical protein
MKVDGLDTTAVVAEVSLTRNVGGCRATIVAAIYESDLHDGTHLYAMRNLDAALKEKVVFLNETLETAQLIAHPLPKEK